MDINLIYEDETYAIIGSMAADISKTCISIAAFSAAEGVSEHSVVKMWHNELY